MEKGILSKWVEQASSDSHFTIWQNVLQIKLIRNDRERHYILIKGKTHQEDIAIKNFCTKIQRHPTL